MPVLSNWHLIYIIMHTVIIGNPSSASYRETKKNLNHLDLKYSEKSILDDESLAFKYKHCKMPVVEFYNEDRLLAKNFGALKVEDILHTINVYGK